MSKKPKAKKPEAGSANPAYPDAHPTAPGGMSRDALRAELVAKHNYLDIEVDEDSMTWTELIDAVVKGRRDREKEAQAVESGPTEVKRSGGSEWLVLDPGTLAYQFAGHAGAGPSGAERWMNCTKSLGASRAFLETLTPNQQAEFARANPAARQGTTAHAAAEAELSLILGHTSVEERDATLLELSIMPDDGEDYDDEMADHVSVYVDLISEFIDERGEANVLIENRLEAAVWLTGDHEDEYHVITGSGDTVVLPTPKHKSIIVVDYKHGEGLDVDVDSNPQVRIYGLGALSLLVDDEGVLTHDVDEVVYYIVQPRTTGVKVWRESLDDLLTWRDETLAPALTAALFDDESAPAEYKPGDETCQWCPARGTCPALAEQRMQAADELFTVITEAEYIDGPGAFPETHSLDDDMLGRLLTQINGLTQIKDDIKAEVQRRLHRGRSVPGFKLVSYTPARTWVENAHSDLAHWPDLYSNKLLTPKQALTKMGKAIEEGASVKVGDEDVSVEDWLGKYIVAAEPRPIVAPEGDRRKEWGGAAPEALFADESGT